MLWGVSLTDLCGGGGGAVGELKKGRVEHRHVAHSLQGRKELLTQAAEQRHHTRGCILQLRLSRLLALLLL